jgi:hypothetical protein
VHHSGEPIFASLINCVLVLTLLNSTDSIITDPTSRYFTAHESMLDEATSLSLTSLQ